MGLKEIGYGMMPKVEETMVSYLSPDAASSLKAPILPTKLCRITSSLVRKAYITAGQAGACLRTMAILQVYQADLLKDFDEGEEVQPDNIRELRRATYLSLHATKETARAIGPSMTAQVAMERYLWLNLSGIQ